MKKTLLLLIITISLFNTVQAQTSGGPDAYGYVWRDSNDPNGPAYNWVDISTNPEAVLVTGLTDDNFVGPFPLNADFHYYWYDVTQFWVCSNGAIAFANPSPTLASPFPTIPSPGAPQNFLAALLSDLLINNPGSNSEVYYYKSSTNDSLVVSWINCPFWDPAGVTGNNTFQIILNYADSSILFQYQLQTGASAAAANFCEVGIENNSGSIGLEWAHDVYPPSSYAIKFYYPDTTSFQVNDASTAFCDNAGNGGIFLSKNGAPWSMTAGVQNTGNTTLAGFNVSGEVRTATNALQVRDTQAVGALNAGATQAINFADPFIHNTAGIYKMNCITLLAGDATPTNNQKTLEINVVDTTQASIELAYDNGVEAGAGGISWSGGDGGIAMHFIPPFYPCQLTQVKEFIVADPNNLGFSMMIYADDGLNGAPLTLIDSVFVAGGSFTLNAFTTTTLTSPLTISSGGFYVLWFMGGDQVAIGQNQVAPISNRSYEVLGGTAPGNFAGYRTSETEDLMIRAVIQKIVGVEEIKAGELFSQFYPNPALDKATLSYDISTASARQVKVELFNIAGKLVYSEMVGSVKGQLDINVKNFDAGMYLCKFIVGNTEVNRKLTIVK